MVALNVCLREKGQAEKLLEQTQNDAKGERTFLYKWIEKLRKKHAKYDKLLQ